MNWSYGVTTCPQRIEDGLLKKTLDSLAKAGFDEPRLFIDGESNLPVQFRGYQRTFRFPKIRTFGNWVLGAWELYLRNPTADRFALFQDDFVTYKNLRKYLEQCNYPKHGYWNLYTFPCNEKKFEGWYLSNQRGLGAVALVFSNEALRVLLRQQHMVDRPLDAHKGWRSIDGGIVDAFKKTGWQEYVHNPSLVQHTGKQSSMGNGPQESANTFLGEDFDAMDLVEQTPVIEPVSRRGHRIGLVGWNCNTGLGELNRQLATYGEISTWLVRPHPKHPSNPSHEGVDTLVCQSGNRAKIEKFVGMVDTVVFCEQPYYPELIDLCVQHKRRTVCIPMMEWMPPGAKGWPRQVDLFICPTKQCYDIFAHVVPCVYFPWPVDLQRFNYAQRAVCDKFLFLAGHGGWKGRKGISVMLEALKIWPGMPLIVSSQSPNQWPKGVHVLPPTQVNSDLYAHGDVLIAPHSVDGLGLEPMEAMCCGIPVIMTDGEPWNEIPSIGKIPSEKTRTTVHRPVDWYLPIAADLVEICKGLLGKPISEQSIQARDWADTRSWSHLASTFIDLVRNGKGVAATKTA